MLISIIETMSNLCCDVVLVSATTKSRVQMDVKNLPHVSIASHTVHKISNKLEKVFIYKKVFFFRQCNDPRDGRSIQLRDTSYFS